MYTGMVMFLFCTLAENPESDFLLIIHLNPSLKYSFTEAVVSIYLDCWSHLK